MNIFQYDSGMEKRRSLTSTEKEAARTLKSLWDSRKIYLKESGKGRLVQEEAADTLGISQGAISQYLGGKIPLNLSMAAKFAKLLDCTLADISPLFDLNNVAPPTPAEIQSTKDMLKLAFDSAQNISNQNKLNLGNDKLIEVAAEVYEEILELDNHITPSIMLKITELVMKLKNYL